MYKRQGVEFVAAEGDQIGIDFPDVQRKFGKSLHRVYMNEQFGIFPPQSRDDRIVGENGSQFVVDHHKGEQNSIFIYRVNKVVGVKISIGPR